MPNSRGGTKMHCPLCDEITVCATVPYQEGKQLKKSRNGGIWAFSRLRECQDCRGQFETVELSSKTLQQFESKIYTVEQDIHDRIDRAIGANQTILSWNMDLMLKIQAIERHTSELRALHSKINHAAQENKFLKTLK